MTKLSYRDSDSDSDSVPVPSVKRGQRRNPLVLLSDSGADSPAAQPRMLPQRSQTSPVSPGLSPHAIRRSPARFATSTTQAHLQCSSARTQPADLAARLSGLYVNRPPQDDRLHTALQHRAPPPCGIPTQLARSPAHPVSVASPLDLTAPATSSSSASSGASPTNLTFTRSIRRTARLFESSSDSDDGHSPAVTQQSLGGALAAGQVVPARRLNFTTAAASDDANGTVADAVQTSSGAAKRATVRWKLDAQEASDALTGQLDKLAIGTPARSRSPQSAAAATAPDTAAECSSPAGTSSPAGDDSPIITWTATRTPRRSRVVASDSDAEKAACGQSHIVLSDSDAEDQPEEQSGVSTTATAAAPATSAAEADVPATPAAATPWQCTPPWMASVPRTLPSKTPATARPPQNGTTSPARSSPQSRTPEWMSEYKPPPPPEIAATRGELSDVVAAAKTAVPRRRQHSVRLPPEVITLSDDDEHPPSVRGSTLGKENRSPSSPGFKAARPSPVTTILEFRTPKPVQRPKEKAEATAATTGKKAPVPFARTRDQLTKQLYRECVSRNVFNAKVFDNKMPHDLEITWSNTLLKTAGLTHYSLQNSWNMFGGPKYCARIELSARVLDRYSRLRLTLAHELCHAAAWIFDHTAKPPHGQVFYSWAARFTKAYPDLQITTRHDYEIFYAFKWQCTNQLCNQTYGRHSNSLDVTKKCCGRCRAPLVALGRFNPDGTPAKTRAASGYSLFVKENYTAAKKAAGPKTPHKDVMKQLSVQWSARKKPAER